jgi:hypothetical protein
MSSPASALKNYTIATTRAGPALPPLIFIGPKLSDFLLDLHQSLAHQELAKSLDISIGMFTLFANLAASRSQHISSQKIAQFRLENTTP